MGKGPKPVKIVLSDEERSELDRVIRRHTTPQQLVKRARIIQLAASGTNNAEIKRELGISIDMVRLWRGRWAELAHVPLVELNVEGRLSDLPRSGSPGKFSAEQIVQIIAIACEDPQASGYPVSHWTSKEVAEEAEKRGIVESISERQAGRFLKSGGSETTPEPLLVEYNGERP